MKDDIYIVSPGRSVLTAKRGMAHAGGKITLDDVSAKVMDVYVKSGKVTVDMEAREAREVAKETARLVHDKAIKDGKKRAGAAKAVVPPADDPAAAPTEAEIIEAIGKLDKGNTEHWTTSGKPMVPAIEGVLGKQISATDRDAAWAKMN